MVHPGVISSLVASALLLTWALLRNCPGVVQRPEPGGGATWGSLWHACHQVLASEVAWVEASGEVRCACMLCTTESWFLCLYETLTDTLAAQLVEHHSMQGVDLLFYGDSITENWRGTSVGRLYPGGQGMPAVYQKHFGGYKSAVLAIAGDYI